MKPVPALALALAGCGTSGTPVTITGPHGAHIFHAQVAATAAAQARGLMGRRDLGPDDAMLFSPYPPDGPGPRMALIWMKDTPTPLDVLFIRADGTIARIAPMLRPNSTELTSSGEPVAAMLEVVGGRAAATGVAVGDRVSWPR